MSQKQKAIELVDKFIFEHYATHDYAKQCALICANEMIDVLWHTHINPDEFNYWQEVKTEIEKL